MRYSSFLRRVVLALLIGLSGSLCLAVPQYPQVFTGPDIGRYFKRLWVPDYPYVARRDHVSGRGTYRAYVEPDGKVAKVVVIKSAGLREFDEAVIKAAVAWRAHPGKKKEIDFPMAFISSPR